MSHTVVAQLEEFPVGHSRIVEVAGRSVAVFHTEEGVFAVQNDCPHAWAPLASGSVDDCRVTCPMHGWSFDLRNGEPVDAPPGATLQCYQVEIADGEVRLCVDGGEAEPAS
jgi:nitrite reductase/ring-hydroxylating ferredoxin subunit